MTDRETLDVYDARAAEYAGFFDKDEEADTQLRHFLDLLPTAARLLDIGCGPGRSAGIMAKAGHDVTATDASAEMVALATQWPGVTALQETFDDLTGTEVYDGIWANFSLLHATRTDLPRHIAAIAHALKSGGVFHIGMKTGENTSRDSLGRRYTYVTGTELNGLLTGAGMTTIATWTGAGPGLSGEVSPWIVIQARKNA